MAYQAPRRTSGGLPASVQFSRLGLWLLSRPFVWTYNLLNLVFRLDQRGAASNLKRLKEEVESECADMFSIFGGRIVPELSSGLPYFDFATVVVEVRSLQLKATRDRGFTSWEVSSRTSPWEPLEIVCQRFAPHNSSPQSPFKLLSDHFSEIEKLLA
jgi:hypothetical protein